ncbi:MAG: glycine cleavage system protein GcvH [Candidatus Eremiobacteraeota bacterium]|nr:glycine cleavage system protein GcvH [Candidatus Eremiobacteraeota bacterium]MBV8668812.1 glycine cleavage system protein GcvH [Candidatus Eremiobacteraeota bacterium]
MSTPTDRLYTKEHEWAKIDGQTAVIGITDYAQSSLGDIVYVEMPKPGASVERGKPMGVVESVKAVSDIYAPVSGTVAEVNASVEDDQTKVNNDPYGEGWLVKVTVRAASDKTDLMDAASYDELVKSL